MRSAFANAVGDGTWRSAPEVLRVGMMMMILDGAAADCFSLYEHEVDLHNELMCLLDLLFCR